jgi:NAD(P)-dependent dehydrogenase (short-subunit alcohol dehydrogenase family)
MLRATRPCGSIVGMARVFVTGSTVGLGRAAAEALLEQGHQVIVHARNSERASLVDDLVGRGARLVLGDLASGADTRHVADQVNAAGGVDAVIHNAAVYVEPHRAETVDGHARTVAVNVVAPYLLTAWIVGPRRLIYMSSGMHESGDTSLADVEWIERRWNGVQAYCDSKLLVTALTFALAERWPDRRVHAVDPGWVPTRMGGAGAPDDLELGHRTQAWLAVTDEPGTAEPGYWHHQQRRLPVAAALDRAFQAAVMAELARITGVELPL